MRNIIITILCLFAYYPLAAQIDTVLVGYSEEDYGGSRITEMTPLKGNKIGFTK